MIRRLFHICSSDNKKFILFVTWILLLLCKPWSTMGKEVTRIEDILLKSIIHPFAPTNNAHGKCFKDSNIYLESFKKFSLWALQMYDASSKISAGLLTGNYRQFGNYDECLRVKTDYGFTGQACNAKIQFKILLKRNNTKTQVPNTSNVINEKDETLIKAYQLMWCVPSTCTSKEISQGLDHQLESLSTQDEVNVKAKVIEVTCHKEESDSIVFNTQDSIYTGILLLFLIIIFLSTVYDIIKRRGAMFDAKDKKHIMLSSFSLYTNAKHLFSIKRSGEVIGCLDGLRFLSICWIIYGHTYYVEVSGIKLDLTSISTLHENLSNLLVLNANIVTDTFLLLSAVLLSYIVLLQNEKNPGQILNLMNFYMHRFLRLTPAYAMVIGFYATLFYKLGSGPNWDYLVGANSENCRKNWWTNLLYINNYVNVHEMCLSQSWYLSIDMQLFWISPFFLYPMLKFKSKLFFWILLIVGFIVSISVPFLLTYCQKLPGTMLYYKGMAETSKIFVEIYIKTYARTGPYMIGLGLGYLLHKTRSNKMTMSLSYVIFGWIFALIIGLSAFLGSRELYFSYNRIEASFYAGFHRQAFAFAVSWIIFASNHGYAGPIGKILSWRGWMPFSKLTYSAYLCHYIILLYYSGMVRASGDLSMMNVLKSFFGNLTMTMMISVIICLCFERPFLTLNRAINCKNSNFSTKSNSQELYIRKSIEDSVASISQIRSDNSVVISKNGSDMIDNPHASTCFSTDEKNEKTKSK